MAEEDIIFRELQEDIKRDRARALWDKYGTSLIAICVAVVVGTAAGVAWKAYQTSKNREATTQVLSALKESSDQQNAALEKVAKEMDYQGVGAIAALNLARNQIDAGEGEAALATYKALADNDGLNQGIRNLAKVMAMNVATQFKLEAPKVEAPKKGDAFYADWNEARAWKLYSEGDTNGAQRIFREILKDRGTALAMRQRVQLVYDYLGPLKESDEEDKSDEPDEESPEMRQAEPGGRKE